MRIRKRYIVLLISAIITAVGFGVLFAMFKSDSTNEIVVTSDDMTIDNSFCAEMEQSKNWASEDKLTVGGQYDGTIHNNSAYDVSDWHLTIEGVPSGSFIDSYWDGEFTLEDGVISVYPKDYNHLIIKDTGRPFGMVLYTPYSFKPDKITIYIKRSVKITDYTLFWVLHFFVLVVLISVIITMMFEVRIRLLNRKQQEYREVIVQSLKTFSNAIDAKDQYTVGHSSRVAIYSREIARRLGMNADEQERIYYTALLHDIGKIGISDAILHKPGALTPEERRIIQQHAVIGGDILKDFTSIKGIADGARYHHERYDGNGYAEGRKGDNIPICARIICVADSYDAMASSRCYRNDLDEA